MPIDKLVKERGLDLSDLDHVLPILVINIVIFTIYNNKLCIVMIPNNEPWKWELILPGWLVLKWYSLSENLDDLIMRKMWIKLPYKEQLYTFWNPDKNQDIHFISVNYFTLINKNDLLKDVDLTKINLVEYENIENLNIWFNHKNIIRFAKNKLNFRLEYTTIWKYMLPPKFTIPQMQKDYEIMFWEAFDKRNFRKKVQLLNIVKLTGEYDKSSSYRPAKLYEFVSKEIEYLDDERINLVLHNNND
ncbi:MAG: hypothetical protein ACD_3C00095G0004 [uncultured bacterium (gcode 4)]|uniref:NrtR DNA-binding winged helix domain-containing protein n=1 Tax=uncultured bacterium (gcode 4) TaxID=1234023 RepID=K2FAH0_9BACT|nr:MAG: hypothetical protein ACD_3C00095G0004 [uncultured bacterium (gcode 4)]